MTKLVIFILLLPFAILAPVTWIPAIHPIVIAAACNILIFTVPMLIAHFVGLVIDGPVHGTLSE